MHIFAWSSVYAAVIGSLYRTEQRSYASSRLSWIEHEVERSNCQCSSILVIRQKLLPGLTLRISQVILVHHRTDYEASLKEAQLFADTDIMPFLWLAS